MIKQPTWNKKKSNIKVSHERASDKPLKLSKQVVGPEYLEKETGIGCLSREGDPDLRERH